MREGMRGCLMRCKSPWVIAWICVFVFVTLAFGLRSFNELTRVKGDSYLTAASRYVQGQDVYVPQTYWPYPPAMLLTVAPLALIPEMAARIVWGAMLATCVVLSAFLVTSVVMDGVTNSRIRRRTGICLIAAAAVCHQHILSPLTYFSHDFILVLCLAVGLAATVKRRELWAGCAFGIGAALKVTPGLFFAMLLIQRRWKAVAAMFLAGVVLTVAPDMIRPPKGESLIVGFYRIAVESSNLSTAGGGRWAEWNPLAQNMSATISRWTMETPHGGDREHLTDWSVVHLDTKTRAIVTIAASLLVLGVIGWVLLASGLRFDRSLSPLTRLNEIGAVACGMVLLAPHSSNYHFAVLYFAIASCFIALMKTRDWMMIGVAGILCVLGLPSGRDLIGHFPVQVMLIYGKITMGALVALVGCWRVAVLQRRERQGGPVHDPWTRISCPPVPSSPPSNQDSRKSSATASCPSRNSTAPNCVAHSTAM